MADVQPLRALHYDQSVVGSLSDVVAPPYDVIDNEQRAALLAQLALQRGRRRSAPGRARSVRGRGRAVRELAAPRRSGARRRAGDLGAHPGLHGPGREGAHAPRLLLSGAHRGLRPGQSAPARAHAPGPQGGSSAPDARHAGERLADLLALLRSLGRRLERAGSGNRDLARGARSPTATARSTASGASATPTRSRPSSERPRRPSC